MKHLKYILISSIITGSLFAGRSEADSFRIRAGSGGIEFEGATNDAFETTIIATDPTADRTITLKDESGTVAFLTDISGAGGTINGTISVNEVPRGTALDTIGPSAITDDGVNVTVSSDVIINSANKIKSSAGDGTTAGASIGMGALNLELYGFDAINFYVPRGTARKMQINANSLLYSNLSVVKFLDSPLEIDNTTVGVGSFKFDASTMTGAGVVIVSGANIGASNIVFEWADVGGTLAVDNGLTVDTFAIATVTSGELVDSNLSQNGAGNLEITNYTGILFPSGEQAVLLTADNQVVTPTASSVNLTSDDVTAANRTFTVSTVGAFAGQTLMLVFTDATDSCELIDGASNALLSATWTPTIDDVILLIFNGTDWREVSRSAN